MNRFLILTLVTCVTSLSALPEAHVVKLLNSEEDSLKFSLNGTEVSQNELRETLLKLREALNKQNQTLKLILVPESDVTFETLETFLEEWLVAGVNISIRGRVVKLQSARFIPKLSEPVDTDNQITRPLNSKNQLDD